MPHTTLLTYGTTGFAVGYQPAGPISPALEDGAAIPDGVLGKVVIESESRQPRPASGRTARRPRDPIARHQTATHRLPRVRGTQFGVRNQGVAMSFRTAPSRRSRIGCRGVIPHIGATLAVLAAVLVVSAVPPATAVPRRARRPRVLRVGTWHGRSGQFSRIQDAVNAARPGDWILVAPGDYHERGDHAGAVGDEAGAAVLVRTPGIHIRGMDRNRVILDGTKPGARRCSRAATAQDLGPIDQNGKHLGRNGIEVFEVDGVSIDNLTACNFLNGDGGGGNAIWWNGGDGTGTRNLGAF